MMAAAQQNAMALIPPSPPNSPDRSSPSTSTSPPRSPRPATGTHVLLPRSEDDGYTELDKDLANALERDYRTDLYIRPPKNPLIIQSLIQLENRWKYPTAFFELYTMPSSLPLVSLESLKFMGHIDERGNKVHAVARKSDSPGHEYFYVLKTMENSRRGWKRMYHELRQLLCMPPHPNIIPAPLALVHRYVKDPVEDMAGDIYNPKPRVPICGFLLPFLKGQTLCDALKSCNKDTHAEFTCPCEPRRLARWMTKAKWCRQLAEALVHILRHGNGPDRPGFYSDLKPNNIMVTLPDRDIVLLDFEQAGNWEEFTAPEVLVGPYEDRYRNEAIPCYDCFVSGLGRSDYIGDDDDDDDDVFEPSFILPGLHRITSTHPNGCRHNWEQTRTNPANRKNDPSNAYGNPPWGYYDTFWTTESQQAKERAMVYSLGKVYRRILLEQSHRLNSVGLDIPFDAEVLEIPEKVAALASKDINGMMYIIPHVRPTMEAVLAVISGWERDLELHRIGFPSDTVVLAGGDEPGVDEMELDPNPAGPVQGDQTPDAPPPEDNNNAAGQAPGRVNRDDNQEQSDEKANDPDPPPHDDPVNGALNRVVDILEQQYRRQADTTAAEIVITAETVRSIVTMLVELSGGGGGDDDDDDECEVSVDDHRQGSAAAVPRATAAPTFIVTSEMVDEVIYMLEEKLFQTTTTTTPAGPSTATTTTGEGAPDQSTPQERPIVPGPANLVVLPGWPDTRKRRPSMQPMGTPRHKRPDWTRPSRPRE